MTPTLQGRWQTRLLLMTLFGIPITLIFAQIYGNTRVPFALLGYVSLCGLGWDIVYSYVQSWRWNRDWPPLFALYAGLWEGSCLFVLTQVALPLIVQTHIAQFYMMTPAMSLLPGIPLGVTIGRFWLHYGTVFGVTWLASMGLLQVLLPHWRYRGGQWMTG